MRHLLTVLIAGLVLMGCERDSLLGPGESSFGKDRAGSPALNVVTYNVYYGAPIQELAEVSPDQIPFKAAELWWEVQATNFHERAEAIADGIQAADAHLVALLEMTLFRSESPSDFDPMNPFPLPPPDAENVELDYVDILVQALDDRGLSYDVAFVTPTLDIEVPMVNYGTGGLDDLRLTELDVILVRSGVEWTNAMGDIYYAQLPIPVGPQTIYKPSGWASVDITFKGLTYTFINTHLEPDDQGVKESQAAELIRTLGAEAAFKKITDPHGPFVGKTSHVFCINAESGTLLAHKVARFVGSNMHYYRDADGNTPYTGMLEKAAQGKGGWTTYMTYGSGPEKRKTPGLKNMYFLKVPGEAIVLCCGHWKDA